MSTAEYKVISHYPSQLKSEHVYIGVIVFFQDGKTKVHLLDDLRKLKAIDPNANIDIVRSWADSLPKMLEALTKEEKIQFMQNFGSWRISQTGGSFEYETESDYLVRLSVVMDMLSAQKARTVKTREHTSRLHLDVKDQFQIHGWLGKNIAEHEIVTRYELREEVSAEFALKNGSLHVIETLDLRTSNISEKRKEARAKALVLDVAKKIDSKAKTYTVIAGISQSESQGTRSLMGDYSDFLINWESPQEVDLFYHKMADATGKPMLKLR